MISSILQKDYKNIIYTLRGDFLGAIIAAIVALPQALAFGIATGLGPSAGIWSAIILCFTAALLGANIPLISGPTGPTAIVIASVMAASNFNIELTVSLMIMAALIQIILSLTKVSEIIKYIPYPVISGFMNGVGMILIIMQIKPLIGHKPLSSPLETVMTISQGFSSINLHALLLGVITLIIVFAIPKAVNRFIPSQLIALIVCTAISIIYGFNVERIGAISMSFPAFSFTAVPLKELAYHLPAALTLAIVCSTETLLTTLVLDSLTKQKTNSNLTLFSQGTGNLLCALSGSLLGAGATMRSVAALKNGASTKIAAIVSPLILIFILMKLLHYTEQIPLAVLAGILIKIGYDIIDTKFLKVIKFAPKDDLYVLILVFILTVFYNLIFAIGAGITLAALLYAKRVADQTNLGVKTIEDRDIKKLEKQIEKDFEYKIRVVHIDGHFFFGSATQIISQFEELLGTKYLIINYEDKSLLDISAIFALEDIIVRLQSQKINVIFVITNQDVLSQLQALKIVNQIKEENIFYSEVEAIEHCKNLLKVKIKKKLLNNPHGLWKNNKK